MRLPASTTLDFVEVLYDRESEPEDDAELLYDWRQRGAPYEIDVRE